MDKRQEKNLQTQEQYYNSVILFVGPQNMNSNFFYTFYIKNVFFFMMASLHPSQPYRSTPLYLHCMKGRCSIAISPGFPFSELC